MRKFLIAAFALVGIMSASPAAHATCAPANPFATHVNPCPGPRFGSVQTNGYVINGPRSPIPYALRYNCGNGPCLYGRVAYDPPVRSPYYVGNARPAFVGRYIVHSQESVTYSVPPVQSSGYGGYEIEEGAID